jgi:hypothetical protein
LLCEEEEEEEEEEGKRLSNFELSGKSHDCGLKRALAVLGSVVSLPTPLNAGL